MTISSQAKAFALQQRTCNCDELADELGLTTAELYDRLMTADEDAEVYDELVIWEPFEGWGREAVLEEFESTAAAAQMMLEGFVMQWADDLAKKLRSGVMLVTLDEDIAEET